MNTKSLIQSSANVIRIVSLSVGDIYKRYSDSTYDSSVYYGIVKAVNNNGEKTFIEAVEYKKSYSSISADFVVFGGEKDVSIFPATIEEIQSEFVEVGKKLEREIKDKYEEIEDKKKCLAETNLLISGELSQKLKSADFKELTQSEYNQLKIARAQSQEI